MNIFCSSIVDPDASTVVYNNDVGNFDDFMDDLLPDLPQMNDNGFDFLNVSKDSSYSGITLQDLQCLCCLQELDDFNTP